jgi:hypothetical protein
VLSFAGYESIQALTCIKARGRLLGEHEGMNMTAEPISADGLATTSPKVKSANFASGRLGREWRTMAAMIKIHCRDHHGAAPALCAECQGLLDYANVRLDRCRFGEDKPTCAMCPVHCHQKTRRDQVKAVMRYAGPRMMWEHPLMSLRHWLDGFRKAPVI